MNARLVRGLGFGDSVLQLGGRFNSKLAKCCMRVSISISDLGVFLAEPVLARAQKRSSASLLTCRAVGFRAARPGTAEPDVYGSPTHGMRECCKAANRLFVLSRQYRVPQASTNSPYPPMGNKDYYTFIMYCRTHCGRNTIGG